MRSLVSSNWSSPRRTLPSNIFADVFGDFDRIANALYQSTLTAPLNFQPSCDVHEADDHYMISFDVPGIKKEDIKIDVQGNQLTVTGERQQVAKNNGEYSIHHERVYGKFERTFILPNSVNPEKIEAHYEDGVLNVALPKSESSKPRTIEVQSGHDRKFLGGKKDSSKDMKEIGVS